MRDQDSVFPPAELPLRGLDPEKLLGLLDIPAEAAPSLPGWRILGVAGRGGFGTVWRARRDDDAALAAIKIATGEDPDTLERIEGEIETLRALDHPHIVRLLASGPAGADDAGMFLAMEFVDGSDLSQEIPPGGMHPPEAYRIFRQIAEAVGHAHDHGVLHRDLKPANVMLDSEGQVHVADFGLALPIHRRVHQLSLTRAGMVAGTAEYLPPEAYHAGYQPSPAADIFALGVILHEMLTGTPPRGAWLPASSKRGVDVRIDGIIARAMDPLPSCRWKDAAQMLAELDAVISSPPRYAGTPLVTRPVRLMDGLWTLLGVLLLLCGASSLLHLRKSSFSMPLNLVGKHEDLVGGYHAIFVLLIPSVGIGLWQALRVWRFRHVPMREALPSPFGLRLGNSRVAAAMVALGQFFCLVLPVSILISIWFNSCSSWLRPEDPAWRKGLAVVSWQDGSIVSPWTFPGPGDGFWLQENYGPPGHPLARSVDRIGFTPLLFPLMMLMGACSLASAVLVTLAISIRSWWFRGRRASAVTTGLVTFAVTSLAVGPAIAALTPPPPDVLMQRSGHWTAAQMTHHIRLHAKFLVGARESSPLRGPITHWTGYYPETFEYRDHGTVHRQDIERLWNAAKTHARNVEVSLLHLDHRWSASDESFAILVRAVETCDHREADGASAADEVILFLNGIITKNGGTTIHGEHFSRVTLYQTWPHCMSADEVASWAYALKNAAARAASDPASSAVSLGSLFHPLPFTSSRKVGPWLHAVPSPDSGLIAEIREHLQLADREDIVIEKSLPGGRTRIRLRLKHSAAEEPRWLTADLIQHDGMAKCVRIWL